MTARLCGFLVLLATAAVLWFPEGPERSFDLGGLEAALAGGTDLEPDRFPDDPGLPDAYLWLVARGDGALRSIYVGFYPTRGLAAAGPHDPRDCYSTQGWDVGPFRSIEVRAGGEPASIEATTVHGPEEDLFVTFWSQTPLGVMDDRTAWSQLASLFERWRSGRGDMVWVRVEWSPQMGEAGRERELRDRLERVIGQVSEAFER
ncbi:MAG: hypothetical protein Fur0037_18580 [Planctomycetota bacterium]